MVVVVVTAVVVRYAFVVGSIAECEGTWTGYKGRVWYFPRAGVCRLGNPVHDVQNGLWMVLG